MMVRTSGIAGILLMAFAASACATKRAPNPYLTPAEQQLRQQVERDRNIEGAVAGCVIGGIIGALVDDNNRGRGAAIGCAAGGVTGYVASEYVNARNAEYADAQAAARGREEGARQAAARYRQNTQLVRSLIDEEKRKIASLNAQYQARQITAAQYRQQVASANENIELVNAQIKEIDDTIKQIDADIAEAGGSPGMQQRKKELLAEREKLRTAAAELSQVYSREIPAEVRTAA